jgi:hypothetical protein
MKRIPVLVGIVIVSLSLASCATQRYGRLQEVTSTESKILTCEQIDLEIEKCNYFIKGTNDQDAKFTGSDVLGFLGDFGIGNSMEHTAAIESATDRLTELTELKKEKGCINTSNSALE